MVIHKSLKSKHKSNVNKSRKRPKSHKTHNSRIIQWRITDKMIDEWKHLSCSNKIGHDCVINSLAFFKLIDIDLAKELSKKTNFSETGLTQEQIKYLLVDHMTKLHSEKNTHIVASNISLDNKEDIKHFFNNIHNGYGTIISLFAKTNGHMLIFAKDSTGNGYLIDPQTQLIRKGNEEIIPFIDNSKFIHLTYWNLVEDRDIEYVDAKPGNLHKRKRGILTPSSTKRPNSKTQKNSPSPFKPHDEGDHSPQLIKKKRRPNSPLSTSSMEVVYS